MADSNGGGISRRHVIAGVAWSAPAILVATAVPAAAGSLATGALVYIGLNAKAVANFWDLTASQSIPATVVVANVQNLPTTPGGTSSSVTAFDITFEVPVGNVAVPRWGVGSNLQGITDPTTWELVSGPTVAPNGIATLVIRYKGPSIPTYSTRQPSIWIQTESAVAGQSVNSFFVATHADGSTSNDADATVTVLGVQGTLPEDTTHPGRDWIYSPPAGAAALAAAGVVSTSGSGNSRTLNVSLPLAAGVSLTGVTLKIDWVPQNGTASVGVASPGGLTWSASPVNVSPTTFTASAGISDATTMAVTFNKATAGSAYTLTLSAFVNGSSTLSTKTLTGTL